MSETAVTVQPIALPRQGRWARCATSACPCRRRMPRKAPLPGLLSKIMEVDADRVTLIARVLNQASNFNEVVREQIKAMEVASATRPSPTPSTPSRDDARGMVAQMEDGKISTMERLSNVWQKATRGDIASTLQQDPRHLPGGVQGHQGEHRPRARDPGSLSRLPRALKQAGVLALEVLKSADARLATAKTATDAAVKAAEGATAMEPAERAKLELARDEALRHLQAEDGKYQIAKDLADNLTVSYNTSEVIMARLVQITTASEARHQQSVSFFSTNEAVLTALTASFTGMHGCTRAPARWKA